MYKSLLFRMYPNKEQQKMIERTFGCCRLVYNKFLVMRNKAFANGHPIHFKETSLMLTQLKKTDEYKFLRDIDSRALAQANRDLDTAFKNYFSKKAHEPRLKQKNGKQSFRIINQYDSVRIAGKYIRLGKLGYIKIRQTMEVGHIHSATVKKSFTGKYFVSLLVDFEPEPILNQVKAIGIDVGIRDFYTDSNGIKVPNPKYYQKMEWKLAREQRKLLRKLNNSKNRNKQRIRVARVYEKIANQRNDFLQKLSTSLVRENQTICVEDLNVRNMMRNHNLAKAISDAGWSKFFDLLEYKAVWYGNQIIRVPTMYPSSQTCSSCGYKNQITKDINIRRWECPVCHTVHDRDINASINILKKG